jgi:hypothetical protein
MRCVLCKFCIVMLAIGTAWSLLPATFYVEPTGGMSDAAVIVDGYVVDTKGSPLGGVTVLLCTHGKPGATCSCVTDKDTGKYAFKVNLGASFDILYAHSKYDPGHVSALADAKPQLISKVLYPKGEGRPTTAVVALMHTMDRFTLYASQLDSHARQEFFQSMGYSRDLRDVFADMPEMTDGSSEEFQIALKKRWRESEKQWYAWFVTAPVVGELALGTRILSPLLLLGQRSIQKELGLTDEQVDKVKEAQKVRGDYANLRPDELPQKMQEMARDGERVASNILKRDQMTRLKQITLQVSGLQAFNDPEVAKALDLTDEQKEKTRAAVKDNRFQPLPTGGTQTAQKRMAETPRANLDKVMNLLTSEQKAKWQEMPASPSRVNSRSRARAAGAGPSRWEWMDDPDFPSAFSWCRDRWSPSASARAEAHPRERPLFPGV